MTPTRQQLQTNAVKVSTYTIRAADDLPAIVWRAEQWRTGGAWRVDIFRDGVLQAEAIAPNDVIPVIRMRGARDARIATRIANKLIGA